MSDLNFIRTFSIPAWKTSNSVSEIEIIENPNTGKLFFSTDNGITGAVTEFNGEIAISQVAGSDGVEFFMIHKKGSKPDNVKATL